MKKHEEHEIKNKAPFNLCHKKYKNNVKHLCIHN